MHKFTIALLAMFLLSLTAFAQQGKDKTQRPSPPSWDQCSLPGGKMLVVGYSSPRLKGRTVGKEVAPYGEVWRTGANEATTLITTADLTIDGHDLPAGGYTLFTLPTADKWTLIINKHTGEWGIPYKYESEELARVPMQLSAASSPVEDFNISFDQKGGGCTLQLSWGTTQASVTFKEK